MIGQTSSQVRTYFKQKQLNTNLLDQFFEGNAKQRKRSGLGSNDAPDGKVMGEASSIGKVAALSVYIAKDRVGSIRATAENRFRLGLDKEMQYVPVVEELLALGIIHEIGHNRTGHRHPTIAGRGEGKVGFMRGGLLTPEGFEAALNSPENKNVLDRFNRIMHNQAPAHHGPYQNPSNFDCYRNPRDNYQANKRKRGA